MAAVVITLKAAKWGEAERDRWQRTMLLQARDEPPARPGPGGPAERVFLSKAVTLYSSIVLRRLSNDTYTRDERV